MQTDIVIPLSQLVRSPFNVRQQRSGALDTLAASLLFHGQLHNLLVHPMDARRKKLQGVADGERRRMAFKLLHDQGKIKANHPVRCRIITKDEAVALSLAANVEREPMHPCDEYEAFKILHDDGKSVEAIAAAFGVTPRVVSRRLKLANVAPRFLTMYREGQIELEQLMALALTDEHERQEKMWDSLPKYSRHPNALRAALTDNEVDAKRHPIARYVTLKTYEKAGGPVRRDLFSDEDAGYVQDVTLLHQLATTKLQRKLTEVSAEGWSWTEARLHMDYSERSAFGRVPMVPRVPTKAEAKSIAKLETRLAELRAIEADASDEEQEDHVWEIEEELVELRQGLRVPDPNGLSYAGAIVTIDDSGRAEVLRGLVREADKKRVAREVAAQTGDADDSGNAPARQGEFSERLTRNLTAHFTVALQLSLTQNVHVALAALAYPLAMRVFNRGGQWKSEQLVKVSHTTTNLERDASNIVDAKAYQAFKALHQQWNARVPQEQECVLGWLLGLPQSEQIELIAFCTATAVDGIDRAQLDEDAKQLAGAVSLDMSQWWEPTAESFLAHIPKNAIARAATEVAGEDAAASLAKAKKDEAVRTAEQLLAGKGWLPSVLRL